MGQFYSDNSHGQKNNNQVQSVVHGVSCHVMIITSSCFDRLQAALWFIKATELAPNDPKAFYNLGRLAIEEQNFRKAVKLFELAAHNGLTLAAFNMAVAYYKGSGADQGKRVLSFNRKR